MPCSTPPVRARSTAISVFTGEDYDAWRYTLEKTVRKELERSWRVFTRDPAASFALITDTSEALRILSTTEVQQGILQRPYRSFRFG